MIEKKTIALLGAMFLAGSTIALAQTAPSNTISTTASNSAAPSTGNASRDIDRPGHDRDDVNEVEHPERAEVDHDRAEHVDRPEHVERAEHAERAEMGHSDLH